MTVRQTDKKKASLLLQARDKQNCKILIATLGCRLNQTESESLAGAYIAAGYDVMLENASASDDAMPFVQLVIVNTCAVTQKAEQKARRDIRLLLEKCPNAHIVVTGCYAALSKKEIENIDRRIEVIKKNDIYSIIPYFDGAPPLTGCTPQQAVTECNEKVCREAICKSFAGDTCLHKMQGVSQFASPSFSLFTASFQAHSRASLKIQDGCDGNCAFCTIHIARGPSVSLPLDEAVRRAKEIEANGYYEVSLTGVNLGQWRANPPAADGTLSYLLEELLESTKFLRFRLSSLHPDAIDEKFCRAVSNERIRPHLHLSVQSGSGKILRAMNRAYTREDVLCAVNYLRKAKDNPFIACDIIAGFPGESDDDFNETLTLCREALFAHIHAFPFSPRPGTAAYDMRPCVAQSIAAKRVRMLEEMSKKGMYEYVDKCIGKVYEAVAEKARNGDDINVLRAVTENFLHTVYALSKGIAHPKQGDLIKVRITGHGENGADATGEIAN